MYRIMKAVLSRYRRIPGIGPVCLKGRSSGLTARVIVRLLPAIVLCACSNPNVNVVLFGERQIKPTHRPAIITLLKGGVHTVIEGDTVHGIARRYGLSIRDIITSNTLMPPYLLRVNQRLTLPAPRVHNVVAGDTVYDISQFYQVAMNELVRVNNLPPPYTIIVGDQLTIPGGKHLTSIVKSLESDRVKRVKPKSKPIKLSKPRGQPALSKPPKRTSKSFAWPLGGQVISDFGPKGKGLHNDGINIVAPRGTAVKAAENGIVAYSGNELRGFGNLLLIKHSGGFMSAYAHNEKLLVVRGDIVRRGQTIARVGSTGNVTAPQLHFELRKGKRAIDPKPYLSKQTSQL